MSPDGLAAFEAARPRLFALAYRLLGSAGEAQDAVQDTFLRWHQADRAAVVTPAAWLTRVLTNLCLNRLTSVRARREEYPGRWLPEPVLTAPGPPELAERTESVSLGLLVLLEKLTPAERAVFVLHEAFDYPHREIAEILGGTEAGAQQLLSRARRHLGEPFRRPVPPDGRWRTLVERFLAAARGGDREALEDLLAADVTAWTDGGGRLPAARHPIEGVARVVRYLTGWFPRIDALAGRSVRTDIAEVNGAPAILLIIEGALLGVLAPDVGADGRIRGLRTVINPDKLAFLAAQLSLPVLTDSLLAELRAGQL